MNMITEDYVSFETANLLKEKGFDEPCLMCYTSDKKIGNYGFYNSYKNSEVFALTAPTLHVATKWLRKEHNLHIFVDYSRFDFNKKQPYFWNIVETKVEGFYCGGSYHRTYEDACEAAIKYCLENLV